MRSALRTAYANRIANRNATRQCVDAYASACPPRPSRDLVNVQVNAQSMRKPCGIDASASCSNVVNAQVRWGGMRACMRRVMPRARDERTNEQYGRTYRSPRDPSLALGDAHVRAMTGFVSAVSA